MSQFFVNSAAAGTTVTSVTGTNGVTASPTTGAVTVSGVNATTSTVGVASFNPANFTVSPSGEVTAIGGGTITAVLTANATPQFSLVGTTDTVDFQLTNLVLGSSLPSVTSAIENVGIGFKSINSITSGDGNCGLGYQTLLLLTSGGGNTACGLQALSHITTGSGNTALGESSLSSLISSSSNNTAVGALCLENLGTGSSNICVGVSSGISYTGSESNNILIGNSGTIGESNVLRIGTQGTGIGDQNECFVAGIIGVTVSNAVSVTINTSTGQLGVGNATNVNIQNVTIPGAYPYTVLPTDSTIAASSSAAHQVTLPSAPVTGQTWRVKDYTGTAATHNITVSGNGINIDGASTYVIANNYGSLDIQYSGTTYMVL